MCCLRLYPRLANHLFCAANYSLVFGVPENEFRIHTRLSEDGWFAHLVRALGCDPTKQTSVMCQSGASPDHALWNLHAASAKATQGHLQNCRANSVRSTSIDPPALRRHDMEDCNYHGNEDETAMRSQTAEGDIQAPEIEQRLKRHHPTQFIGMWPRAIIVRIYIAFGEMEPSHITEEISPTQDGVLNAAIRHCEILLKDYNQLHASLESVTVGENRLDVHGHVSDLIRLINALPPSEGFPIFAVDVTEEPDT